jgi:hypothetical protein
MSQPFADLPSDFSPSTTSITQWLESGREMTQRSTVHVKPSKSKRMVDHDTILSTENYVVIHSLVPRTLILPDSHESSLSIKSLAVSGYHQIIARKGEINRQSSSYRLGSHESVTLVEIEGQWFTF